MIKRLALAFIAVLASCASFAQTPTIPCAYNAQHTSGICEVTPIVSTAKESSHQVSQAGGSLVGFTVNNWSTPNALTVMVFDTPIAASPQSGTVTPCSATPNSSGACLIKWFAVPTANSTTAPGTFDKSWAPGPLLHYINGLYIACSSTGPTTITLSSNCTFSVDVVN